MNSYMYPTLPHWFDKAIEKWKSSGKRYMCFPFRWFEPHTLPKEKTKEFWLYLYYSETSTEESELQRVVQYRAKTVQYSKGPIYGADIYTREEDDGKVYFKCEVVEEIRKEDGGFLKESDFRHWKEDKNLLSAMRNSIPPVLRVSPIITVQRTMYWLND